MAALLRASYLILVAAYCRRSTWSGVASETSWMGEFTRDWMGELLRD